MSMTLIRSRLVIAGLAALLGVLGNGSPASAHGSWSGYGHSGHNYCSKDSCRTNANCDADEYCAGDHQCHNNPNYCHTSADCDADELCGSNHKCYDNPNYCHTSADCDADELCGTDHQCHNDPTCCHTNADCDANELCGSNHKCYDNPNYCRTDADCDADEACGADHKCHEKPGFCRKDADCSADQTCRSGRCEARWECSCDADCATGEACLDHSCTPRSTTTTTLPPPAAPKEICGDCIDNDGNGLTDFEDPACCGQTELMTLKHGRLVSKTGGYKLRLAAILASSGLTGANPMSQDVFLQIRPANGADVLCAQIPAGSFKQHRRTFVFRGAKAPVASAKGIAKLIVKMRRNGVVRFGAKAGRAQVAGVGAGPLQVTVGFRSLSGDQNLCSSSTSAFKAAGRGFSMR